MWVRDGQLAMRRRLRGIGRRWEGDFFAWAAGLMVHWTRCVDLGRAGGVRRFGVVIWKVIHVGELPGLMLAMR